MVLLLQTPYVDVSKRPEGKSGMDFSETHSRSSIKVSPFLKPMESDKKKVK
jgi:hypothetical protein